MSFVVSSSVVVNNLAQFTGYITATIVIEAAIITGSVDTSPIITATIKS
jgi:hypothetical protein